MPPQRPAVMKKVAHHVPAVNMPRNGPCLRRQAPYPPPGYTTLSPSKKRAADRSHVNALLEAQLVIANEQEHGSYPQRNIS